MKCTRNGLPSDCPTGPHTTRTTTHGAKVYKFRSFVRSPAAVTVFALVNTTGIRSKADGENLSFLDLRVKV